MKTLKKKKKRLQVNYSTVKKLPLIGTIIWRKKKHPPNYYDFYKKCI